MGNKFISNLSKIIILLAIISGIIFTFSILSNANVNSNETSRNEEEINYLDVKLLSLINYLNNIDLQNYKVVLTKVETSNSSSDSSEQQQSDEQEDSTETGTDNEEKTLSKMEEETIITEESEIDWETIEGELEILCSTWPSILLDLYSLDINSEELVNFSDDLNETIINVKNKDKVLTCMYLAKLYSYLPKFLESNSENDIKAKILESKTYIINAYSLVETKNWDKINTEIAKAESILTSLVNDASLVEDERKYNINKAYILIEELKNSLNTQDVDIFYVKYKNVLEQLNILS